MKLISYAMKLTENPLRWAGHKLLLSVVVIDQIIYLPSLAQVDYYGSEWVQNVSFLPLLTDDVSYNKRVLVLI